MAIFDISGDILIRGFKFKLMQTKYETLGIQQALSVFLKAHSFRLKRKNVNSYIIL